MKIGSRGLIASRRLFGTLVWSFIFQTRLFCPEDDAGLTFLNAPLQGKKERARGKGVAAVSLRYTAEERDFAESSSTSPEEVLEADMRITTTLIEEFLAETGAWEALEVNFIIHFDKTAQELSDNSSLLEGPLVCPVHGSCRSAHATSLLGPPSEPI